MRKRKIMTGMALGFLLTGPAFAEDGVGSWQIQRSTPFTQAVNAAGFLNERLGFTVGYAGVSYVSADGGATWNQSANVSMCRWGLEIIDENTAVSCGNAGHVRITNDAGKTWTPLADFGGMEPGNGKFLSFADGNNGWCATSASLGETSDGGKTWTELELPTAIKSIHAIYLRTPLEGYLLSTKGVLCATADGGKTWKTLKVDWKGNKIATISLNAPLAAVHFDSPDKGFVIAYSTTPERGWNVYQTVDGGDTWTREPLPGILGSLFLSHDGRFVTITDSLHKELVLVAR